MQKIFHLALAICFLITSLPVASVAQQMPAQQRDLALRLENSIRQSTTEGRDSMRAELRAQYASLKEALEQETDPQKIAQLRNKMEGINDNLRAIDAHEKFIAESLDKAVVQEPSSLRVAPPVPNRPAPQESLEERKFLALLASNEISFPDLIEYADPLNDPNVPANQDLRVIVYAAEVIGNTLDSVTKDLPEDVLEGINESLVQMQPRLLFQLSHLQSQRNSILNLYPIESGRDERMERIMAIGTLRITLLKIRRYYERMGIKNPVRFSQGKTPGVSVSTNKPSFFEKHTNPSINIKSSVDPQEGPTWDLYAYMYESIISELRSYRHEDIREGSTEYGHLLVAAEYATFYITLYDIEKITVVVDLFDRDDDINGDFEEFKRPFSAVENTIFTTLFETVRFSPIYSDASARLIGLLRNFSDPNKYSISTRVFAMEAASLMFKPFNKEYLYGEPVYGSQYGSGSSVLKYLFVVNNMMPDKRDKDFFAHSIASVYCYLKEAKRSQYGLDSSEMEELANKLASMYNNIYDIVSNWAVIHNPGTAARPYPQTGCEITLTGNLNERVHKREVAGEIVLFVGECLFWIYGGGPLFSLLGNAFRVTRGAIAVLPRATRAASLASKGSKLGTFTTVVKNGARGANFVEHAAKNGVQIVETVVAPTAAKKAATKAATAAAMGAKGKTATAAAERVAGDVLEEGAAAGAGSIPPPVVLRPIKHTRQLLGKPRWFSWRNLFGRKLSEPVETFAIKTAPDGTTSLYWLSGGSFRGAAYEDLSLSRFVQLGNSSSTLSADLSLLEQQTVASITRGRSILQAGFRKGAFDAFVPLSDGTYWNLAWGRMALKDLGLSVENQTMFLLPRKTFPFWRVGTGERVFQRVTAEQLSAAGAVETSLKELVSGDWVNTAFRHYFQPISWGSKAADLVMPRFILTEAGTSALANPTFAAKMLTPTLLSSPFFQTAFGFGILKGIDYGIGYPLQQWMVKGFVQEDLDDILADHPELEKARQEQMQAADEEVSHKISPPEPAAKMSLYDAVMSSKRPQKDGATLLLPIIAARRFAAKKLGLGTFDTIDGQTRVMLDLQEVRVPFSKALVARNQAIAKAMEEQDVSREDLEKDLKQKQEIFFQQDWVKQLIEVDPFAQDKLKAIFNTYNNTMLSLLDTSTLSLDERKKQAEKAGELFEAQVTQLQAQVGEKVLEEFFNSAALLVDENEDFSERQDAYNMLWFSVMQGYQEDFMQQNPNLAKYPDLSDAVRKALDEYVEAKEALFGYKEEDKSEKQGAIDTRLVEKLDQLHELYEEREGAPSGKTGNSEAGSKTQTP